MRGLAQGPYTAATSGRLEEVRYRPSTLIGHRATTIHLLTTQNHVNIIKKDSSSNTTLIVAKSKVLKQPKLDYITAFVNIS